MAASLTPLIYILAFVGVVILAQTLAGLLFAGRDRTRRVNRRLTMLETGQSHDQVYSALVRRPAAPKLAGRRMSDIYASIDAFCRQAGLRQTPLQLAAVTGAIAGVIWIAGLVLLVGRGGAFSAGAAISLLGAVLLSVLGVSAWVARRRSKRLKAIANQLPLALDVVVRAIRAGHPVVAAVQLAANEMGDPVGSEFGLIVDETSYGAEFREALASFARRTGSDDAHYFAVAVAIQSETGGNLAEVLEGLAKVMRGRATLSMRVKALSSEGKASAYLISVLPMFVVGLQATFNPTFYTDKFSDPIFWPVVTGVVSLYLGGWIMIRRIINFRY